MDDVFGCLRGVDLYKLTSEIVEKKFNELPRINHCPSCEVHLVNMMNEFCRECPDCQALRKALFWEMLLLISGENRQVSELSLLSA